MEVKKEKKKTGRKTKKELLHKKIGLAVSKKTDETMKKLEHAFTIGCTVSEACCYAGITERTYYNWKKANNEEFQLLEGYMNMPFYRARETIFRTLDDDSNAYKFMSKKKRDEFGELPPNFNIQNNGESKSVIGFNIIVPSDQNNKKIE